MQLPKDVTVWRAMQGMPRGLEMAAKYTTKYPALGSGVIHVETLADVEAIRAAARSIIGDRSDPFAFMSTTYRKSSLNPERYGDVLLEIKARKGLFGADISAISREVFEDEILFRAGYRLLIEDVAFDVRRVTVDPEFDTEEGSFV